MSGVRILHFLKDWWKLTQIHQYYTVALIRYWRPFVTSAPLSCHAGSRGPMRMCTNVVYFRVMRRLYRREWNWLWNWLCVNQHPWQRTRGHGEWRHTPTAYRLLLRSAWVLEIQRINAVNKLHCRIKVKKLNC